MSAIISIHSENPQLRLINQVIDVLERGGTIAYPTDSGYALGCILGNKKAMDQIVNTRKLSKHHHFTLMLKDLSHVGEYAKLNNAGFRLLKKILPGAYTFILEGSNNAIVQAILEGLKEPMMSVSLIIKGYEFYNCNDVNVALNGSTDIIIDAGHCPPEPTTVIDLTGNGVVILREGSGSIDFLD
jgi:tRNA A37 threonylcarbamoyladenosine synthetase subunit TsaC/SUA5/YrdC